MSDTPRTDALLLVINEGRVYATDGPRADLCRELEREITSLREQLRVAQERWISVKDRLPELKYRDDSKVPGGAAATLYSESVMVFDGRIRIDHFIQAEGVEGTGTFYVGSRKPVTHWMPLPTPPAESTEGKT